jgi:hypothetical protein
MPRKHRFKTSRGETFCQYCGADKDVWDNECSHYTQGSPHNFVKMKPDNYRKYTVKDLLIPESENIEKLNVMFEDKFDVSIELSTQPNARHVLLKCVDMHANRKGDIKAATKWYLDGIWWKFLEEGTYKITSNPLRYEIRCNRCMEDRDTWSGCC